MAFFFLKDPANAGFSLISRGKLTQMSPERNYDRKRTENREKEKKLMATKPATLVALVCHPNDAKR
jgi:hypothetical protein